MGLERVQDGLGVLGQALLIAALQAQRGLSILKVELDVQHALPREGDGSLPGHYIDCSVASLYPTRHCGGLAGVLAAFLNTEADVGTMVRASETYLAPRFWFLNLFLIYGVLWTIRPRAIQGGSRVFFSFSRCLPTVLGQIAESYTVTMSLLAHTAILYHGLSQLLCAL